VSLFLSLSSTFIHLPFALNLSASSLAYAFLGFFFFFSNIPSVSCTRPFPVRFFFFFQFSYLSLDLFCCDFCFLWRRLFPLASSISAFRFSFLPSRSFMKYSSHSCVVISSLSDSFFFLHPISIPPSLFLFLISLSPLSLSPPLYLFPTSLSLYLLIASRKLFLLIFVLFHSLNAFTASYSHSLCHHSFFLFFLFP
jgi:hypothetical protein